MAQFELQTNNGGILSKNKKQQIMKTTSPQIRNAAFYVQLAAFAAQFCLLGPLFDVPCTIFGLAGLIVLVLTLKLAEPTIQKVFFLLAGGAGTAALLTLAGFALLSWSGHTPGGDGGGITVGMLIVVCPALFLIGAVGGMVCRIKGRTSEKKNP